MIFGLGLSSWAISGAARGRETIAVIASDDAEEVGVDVVDLNVYFFANLPAIPTKIGSSSSSSSVLSSTKMVSSAAAFALPLPFGLTVDGTRDNARVLVEPAEVEAVLVRAIRLGLAVALATTTSSTSSDEPRWMSLGRRGREGPASG